MNSNPLVSGFDAAVNAMSPSDLLKFLTRHGDGESRLSPETAAKLAEAYQRRQREAQP